VTNEISAAELAGQYGAEAGGEPFSPRSCCCEAAARQPLRILSLGAGVQSTTLALMAAKGEIDRPDCAIFADTGWEPRAVYAHLDRLEAALPFPVHRVSAGNIRDDLLRVARGEKIGKSRPQPPFHMRNPDGSKGFIQRQCTRDYKVVPIRREVRRLLGAEGRKKVPPGAMAEQWIGISTDEAWRMKPSADRWIEHRWPLIERRMSRADCRAWLDRAGWDVPKSSCIGCPFHSNEQWALLTPAELEDAAEVERAVQAGRQHFSLNGVPFLHSSLKPIDRTDFSAPGQGNLFNAECEGMCGV